MATSRYNFSIVAHIQPGKATACATVVGLWLGLGPGCGWTGPIGTCNNGKVEGDEECDDKAGNKTLENAGPGDCTRHCERVPADCGDGKVGEGEECDQGPEGGDLCTPDCKALSGCGNGEIGKGEVCDKGAGNVAPGEAVDGDCTTQCQKAGCGNGFLEGAEKCDEGAGNKSIATAAHDKCTVECTFAQCGDGQKNLGEDCDDGNVDGEDACPEQCVYSCEERCGNGEPDPECNETCDGGPDCTPVCKMNFCGDGYALDGEECDDGNLDETDQCLMTCMLPPVCGDGKPEPGEECDDGADNKDDHKCTSECKLNVCGDGNVGPSEECDDGNDKNDDACVDECHVAKCGDSFVQSGVEECDDGNAVNDDLCLNSCSEAKCGDNIVQKDTEECDDGNAADGDGCSNDCWMPRTVFLAKAKSGAFLKGLDGADAYCNENKGKLSGTYMAWLSDSTGSPATRFKSTEFAGWYVLPANMEGKGKVARGWKGLTEENLKTPINIYSGGGIENNENVGVWSNTTVDGQVLGDDHCDDWWDVGLFFKGAMGYHKAVDAKWTDDNDQENCNISRYLYCFQVGH